VDSPGNDAPLSAALGPRQGRGVARRVLVAFLATTLAFVVTLAFSVYTQRRVANDNEELAKGFVPVALRLGKLRATQSTLATLLEGTGDDRDPSAMRFLLRPLANGRQPMLTDVRTAIEVDLVAVGSGQTRDLARSFASDLDTIGVQIASDRDALDALFSALERGDRYAVNEAVIRVGPVEQEANKKIGALATRVGASMDALSQEAKERERRSIGLMVVLLVFSLAVGLGMSIHVSRILRPLAAVTARARAVAQGDRVPKPTKPAEDEIGELAVAFEKMVEAVGVAQSQAVANERLAAIGKMAAHVTHEIRNPLTSISLNIDLLDEELRGRDVGKESHELLASITREVDRLGSLSEEYLRLARIPSPRLDSEDLTALVDDVARFCRPELERAGCELVVDVPVELPQVHFDEAQIRQAILNLLRNAREAMPQGGKVELRVLPEGMSVAVCVSDRGGGIPDAIRDRVFDPFFSTKGEGTGLGLAITKRIVEAHGGALTCEGREGGGTTFHLSLPMASSKSRLAQE